MRISKSICTKNGALTELERKLGARNEELSNCNKRLATVNNELLLRNKDLEARVAELETACTDLILLQKRRHEFVANVTHDLKSPILGCKLVLEGLLKGDTDLEERPQVLAKLVESHRTVLQMLVSLLEVYSHKLEDLVPSVEPVALDALLDLCLEVLSLSIARKRLMVRRGFNSAPIVHTDRALLQRVLLNLIDNAIKFSPEGTCVEISVTERADEVIIAIKDCGQGLMECEVKRVFDKFWQSEQGRKNNNGNGLGLYFSKQIMDVLGGRIECKSEELVGTQFEVALKAS